MKRKPVLLVLLFILLCTAGCKKCYYCQNSCMICEDPHFRILVQSDIFGADYYHLYLDSLVSLGWVCNDTSSNKNVQICDGNSHSLNNDIFFAQQQGYTCTASH